MPAIDPFAISDDMMTAEDAITRLVALPPIGKTEILPLAESLGRVLAADVTSDRDNPPHDNSAVDGYAVRSADLSADGGTVLPVLLRITAGEAPGAVLPPGAAARIFTGAAVPVGADTIIPQEICKVDSDRVALPAVERAGLNLRRRGEDFAIGDVVLGRGVLLRPQEIGMAASVGRAALTVYRKVRVAVFSTGNEIRDPGGDAPPGCIFDSNRFIVMGLIAQLGAEPVDLGILPDSAEALRTALSNARGRYDLILTSGGVSTGEEDHVKSVVESLGSLDFWRLAIRPGRPLAFGRIGETPFLGLPGNPVASMVCFLIFARPMILALAGRKDCEAPVLTLPAAFSFKKRPGRREWLRGWVEMRDGRAVVARFGSEGSGILTSMVAAQGLIELTEEMEAVAEGALIRFLPFNGLFQ